MTEQLPASVYPARLEIDYPDQHDRVTTLFRVFLIIPIAIVIGVLTTGATRFSGPPPRATISLASPSRCVRTAACGSSACR